jgi:hypothetical protein
MQPTQSYSPLPHTRSFQCKLDCQTHSPLSPTSDPGQPIATLASLIPAASIAASPSLKLLSVCSSALYPTVTELFTHGTANRNVAGLPIFAALVLLGLVDQYGEAT